MREFPSVNEEGASGKVSDLLLRLASSSITLAAQSSLAEESARAREKEEKCRWCMDDVDDEGR